MLDRLDQYLRSEGYSPVTYAWIPGGALLGAAVIDLVLLLCGAASGNWTFGVSLLVVAYYIILTSSWPDWPASDPSGLRPGNRYHVIKTITTDAIHIRAGTDIIFLGESFYDSTFHEDSYNDDFDEYFFFEIGSGKHFTIRSDEAPDVSQWLTGLQHVSEQEGMVRPWGKADECMRILGLVENSGGVALRRAKVTLSHNGRTLTGGRTRKDGSFDITVTHEASVDFLQLRVAKDGYEPFETELRVSLNYRVPQLLLAEATTELSP